MTAGPLEEVNARFRGLEAASIAAEPFDARARGVVLIVANNEYRNYRKLNGPPKDLQRLRETFESIGLCVVTVENVADRYSLMDAVDGFIDRLRVSEALLSNCPVIFHYSGHGHASRVGLAIRNLLVMTDATLIASGEDASSDPGFVILDEVVARMAAVDGIKLAVTIDACRVEAATRGSVVPSIETFAEQGSSSPELWIENGRASKPRWLGIYFSAAFGKPALDHVASGASPYAEAIARSVKSARRWHRRLRTWTFDKLMDEVGASLRGSQEPREQTVGRGAPVLIRSIVGIPTAAVAALVTLAILAGTVHRLTPDFISPDVTQAIESCHIATAAIEDVDHPVASNRFTLNEMHRKGHAAMKAAVEACQKALSANPGDRRLKLQLGRAIESAWRSDPCNRSFDRPPSCGLAESAISLDNSVLATAFHYVDTAFGDGAFEPARWTLIQFLMNGVGRSRAEARTVLDDTTRSWRLASKPVAHEGAKAEVQHLEYTTNRCLILDDEDFRFKLASALPQLEPTNVDRLILDACQDAADRKMTSALLRISYRRFYDGSAVSKKGKDDAFSLIKAQIENELSGRASRVESRISLEDTAYWMWERPDAFSKDSDTFWAVLKEAIQRLMKADSLARAENPQKPSTNAANMLCQIWFNPKRQREGASDKILSLDEYQRRLGLKFKDLLSDDRTSGYCDRAANDHRWLASPYFRAAYYGLSAPRAADQALARADIAAFKEASKRPLTAKNPDTVVDLARVRFLAAAIDLMLARTCSKPSVCEKDMVVPTAQETADLLLGLVNEISVKLSDVKYGPQKQAMLEVQADAIGALMFMRSDSIFGTVKIDIEKLFQAIAEDTKDNPITMATPWICDLGAELLRASSDKKTPLNTSLLVKTRNACNRIVDLKVKFPETPYALLAAKWYRALDTLLRREDAADLDRQFQLVAWQNTTRVALGVLSDSAQPLSADWRTETLAQRDPVTQNWTPRFQRMPGDAEDPKQIEEVVASVANGQTCQSFFESLEAHLKDIYRSPKHARFDEEVAEEAAFRAYACPTAKRIEIATPPVIADLAAQIEQKSAKLIAEYKAHFPAVNVSAKIVAVTGHERSMPRVTFVRE